MLNDPFAVVKECKGAALALLVLLSVNAQRGGGAVTQEWLERHSGYSDKPVSQALVYLRETGRIVETAAGRRGTARPNPLRANSVPHRRRISQLPTHRTGKNPIRRRPSPRAKLARGVADRHRALHQRLVRPARVGKFPIRLLLLLP
jgi:hypothetical protein